MSVSPRVRAVFGHFQNLNLLALLQDLRDDRTARNAWRSGALLCPVAHGLPNGRGVQRASALGQAADLDEGCRFAAQLLGADPGAVLRFVRFWDEGALGREALRMQLEEMWEERTADADAMQRILRPEPRIVTLETPTRGA